MGAKYDIILNNFMVHVPNRNLKDIYIRFIHNRGVNSNSNTVL